MPLAGFRIGVKSFIQHLIILRGLLGEKTLDPLLDVALFDADLFIGG